VIRIAIKEAAFAAIAASLPKGRSAHAERPTGGKVFLWLEDAIVNNWRCRADLEKAIGRRSCACSPPRRQRSRSGRGIDRADKFSRK
jgi:hypothetical protein